VCDVARAGVLGLPNGVALALLKVDPLWLLWAKCVTLTVGCPLSLCHDVSHCIHPVTWVHATAVLDVSKRDIVEKKFMVT
jgi:hypothetical protein